MRRGEVARGAKMKKVATPARRMHIELGALKSKAGDYAATTDALPAGSRPGPPIRQVRCK